MAHVIRRPPTPEDVRILHTRDSESVDKYITNVFINGWSIVGMIDTGSSDCTLKARVMLVEYFKIERVPSELRGFG